MLMTIYGNEITDVFTEDILEVLGMFDIEVPERIVFDFFISECLEDFRNEYDEKEGITAKGYFEDWLNEYTCDDTIGLWRYAKRNNVTPLICGWWK